jgi:predicted membrane-bound dolichyl-phosphate-mannose-protein mannosyltransferase
VRRSSGHSSFWIALTLISGTPRILGVFLLPQAFGDAYAYVHDVAAMSAKMSARTFSLNDLYGFWLPLYQFICAVINVLVNQPSYVSRLVSAVFGVGICLLVYATSMRLTGHRTASLLAFALIALNPLHVFNSASSMTDVPNAFFVLASVYFVMQKRWIPAAILAALAGFTRVDSWMLIALIPALQFFEERRVSPVALAILIFPPLFWFYISWKATGDWLACFVTRKDYMAALLANNPSLASFSLFGIARDIGSLLISTDLAVLAACFVAIWIVIKRMSFPKAEPISEKLQGVVAIDAYFFAFLVFIVLAYLTHKQPIIFPRYGLINFALGAPLLPWTYLTITKLKPQIARRLLILIIVVCVFDASIQLVGSVGFINKVYAHQAVADYLRAHYQPSSDSHIFCDDGTVFALSGIPPERFVSSTEAPRDPDGFLAYLKQKNVEYLVFVSNQDSTPVRLFPGLEYADSSEVFEPVMNSHSEFLYTNIWLYRVRPPPGQ